MATELAEAHITAQQRLRAIIAQATVAAWQNLPGYDEENVAQWLSVIVPIVLAGQRKSAALTDAFLGRAVGRAPIGVDSELVTGAAVRAGTPPEVVYRRPFVTVWSALGNGTEWERAVAAGEDRAASAAETDVQLAMRQTLVEVGARDELILGYQRVPDGDACPFCKLISGQRYTFEQLMPVHNRCGCSVDVITAANRGDFSGKRENDLSIPGQVAVHEHGELGPVLSDPSHRFTTQADIAA